MMKSNAQAESSVERSPIRGKSFREKFCAALSCSDERYEAEALKLFLHSPWSGMATAIDKVRPAFFAVDRQIVERIGNLDNRRYVRDEVRDLQTDYQRANDFGFARRRLRLRLSSARILERATSFWPQVSN